jgi:hypothetical protein
VVIIRQAHTFSSISRTTFLTSTAAPLNGTI